MNTNILATICDLDGIIIQTGKIHAQAWQKVFDSYFTHNVGKNPNYYMDFDVNADYNLFFEKNSNLAGIQAYFQQLHIDLPQGTVDDFAGKHTLMGLAKLKDNFFMHLLEHPDVEIIDENVQQLKEWKQQGMKIVVVSSNKNCQNILKIAKINTLFNLVVNGFVAERHHLRPKPYPDSYLYAASSLDIPPQAIMVVEKDLAGVEAAKSGGFGLTVCLRDPFENPIDINADICVHSLKEIHWTKKHSDDIIQRNAIFDTIDVQS